MRGLLFNGIYRCVKKFPMPGKLMFLGVMAFFCYGLESWRLSNNSCKRGISILLGLLDFLASGNFYYFSGIS